MTDFGKRAGDMSKSTYDADADGVVDDSEQLEGKSKAEVQDHAPKSHTHVEEDVTDLDHDAQKVKGVVINDAAKADQKVLGYDSATNRIVYIAQAAGAVADYVKVSDIKAYNVHGGTFTQDGWRTRDINTEDADTANICGISSNQITLEAGTYECLILCPGYKVHRHFARLYNITDSSMVLMGSHQYIAEGYDIVVPSVIRGRFTITSPKTLEIQHYCTTTHADLGFGACTLTPGFDSDYTVAEFWRVAA